jgi:molybdopterin converting factor subunit 1
MKVKCFGIARDITGAGEVDVDLNSDHMSVGELKQNLVKLYPGLSMVSQFFIAINHEYAEEADFINHDDEVAIIPPVSGG